MQPLFPPSPWQGMTVPCAGPPSVAKARFTRVLGSEVGPNATLLARFDPNPSPAGLARGALWGLLLPRGWGYSCLQCSSARLNRRARVGWILFYTDPNSRRELARHHESHEEPGGQGFTSAHGQHVWPGVSIHSPSELRRPMVG